MIAKITNKMAQKIPFLLFMGILVMSSCENNNNKKPMIETDTAAEKNQILACLDNETKAACARDYASWKTHWVHRPNISKTYMNFADTTFSEMTSWKEVDDFVRTYIDEHPEPVNPPIQADNINVEIYGDGAWVSFEVQDEVIGRKRETRLMEKDNGRWKIAGMHTSIYGFEK